MSQDSNLQSTITTEKKNFFISLLIKIKESPFKSIGIFASILILLLGVFTLLLIIYFTIFPEITEEEIISRIRSDIMPAVVQLRCLDSDEKESIIGTGLYYIEPDSKKPVVETNAHVVIDKDGNFNGCNAYFPRPGDGTFYDVVYRADDVYAYHDKVSGLSTSTYTYGIDYAILELSSFASSTSPFPPDKIDPYIALDNMCRISGYPNINIGDKVYLLGYPETGSDSLTITEGVLSGFTGVNNEWLKISASSNHGNSGGVVIGATNGCNYGVLTRATFLKGSNLGYALSSAFIRQFLKELTDLKPYTPPNTKEDMSRALSETYQFSGLTIKYLEGWSVATSSNKYSADLDLIDIYAPQSSAIKDYVSGMYIYRMPNSNADVMNKTIDSFIKMIKKSGIEDLGMGNITIKGLPGYEIVYSDNSLYSYSTKVKVHYNIFVYKDILYLIVYDYEDNKDTATYKTIFKLMIDSIEFN